MRVQIRKVRSSEVVVESEWDNPFDVVIWLADGSRFHLTSASDEFVEVSVKAGTLAIAPHAPNVVTLENVRRD